MGLELADIFREYGAAYRQKHANHLRDSHLQVMRAIERCRTEVLGGQVYRCPECEQQRYSYHSCRNRHCPKCQHERTEAWLNIQQELLLPVPYFMLTFTIPAELHEITRQSPRLIYSLMFSASAEAAQKLALDPRFVGGQIGLVGVLHTWTRNLAYHPMSITWHLEEDWFLVGQPGYQLATTSFCPCEHFQSCFVPLFGADCKKQLFSHVSPQKSG